MITNKTIEKIAASEDLEEAAEKYAYNEWPSVGIPNTVIELAFKAGAEWQKQKTLQNFIEKAKEFFIEKHTGMFTQFKNYMENEN